VKLPAFGALTALACGFAGTAAAQTAPIDSVSPVFRDDSTKAAAVRAVEAGKVAQDTGTFQRDDSLLVKQRRRGAYIGLAVGFPSFTDHSARSLFSGYMASAAQADSSAVLQPQDPVHIVFPAGLVVGFPVFTYLDVWLRTEHFWSRVTGLTQHASDSPREYWYVTQGHLAGVGARYLVPVSLLAINGKPGLYAAYTHFWSFGPTGIYAPTGGVRARFEPAGAGYEVQLGYQQDYDRRFAFTGGLSFARLTFGSNASWNAILPTGPDERAEWTLQSLRLTLTGIYQFGK
jgi:hypothetical protein